MSAEVTTAGELPTVRRVRYSTRLPLCRLSGSGATDIDAIVMFASAGGWGGGGGGGGSVLRLFITTICLTKLFTSDTSW